MLFSCSRTIKHTIAQRNRCAFNKCLFSSPCTWTGYDYESGIVHNTIVADFTSMWPSKGCVKRCHPFINLPRLIIKRLLVPKQWSCSRLQNNRRKASLQYKTISLTLVHRNTGSIMLTCGRDSSWLRHLVMWMMNQLKEIRYLSTCNGGKSGLCFPITT